MSSVTAGDVLVDGLRRAGAQRLFAVDSPQSPLVDAAHRSGLFVVNARDPSAACVMGAVTGELSRAPGVALLGPGLDAARAGIVHAASDHAPLVILTERGATTDESTRAIVKASLPVAPESAAHWVAHACRLALTAPCGPVHLDLQPHAAGQPTPPLITAPRPAGPPAPETPAVDEAARTIAAASRPVLAVGAGCRDEAAAVWLMPFAEALPAPTLVTLKAKGVLPDPHPLNLGLLGAGATADLLLGRADLIIALGIDDAELADWPAPSSVPVLSLSALGAEAAPHRAGTQVCGDIAATLAELAPRLRGRVRADWDVAELDRLKRSTAAARTGSHRGFCAWRVGAIARDLTVSGTIVTVDAGGAMTEVAHAWQAVAPDEFLASNRLATIGFAIPAGLAAHLARPDRGVLCFTGGPGLVAAAAEIETVAALGSSIIVIVLDSNACGGALAHAHLDGQVAEDEPAFRDALERALARGQPGLVEVRLPA